MGSEGYRLDWHSRQTCLSELEGYLPGVVDAGWSAPIHSVHNSSAIARDLIRTARGKPVNLTALTTAKIVVPHIAAYTAGEVVDRTIPKVSERTKIPLNDLMDAWETYRQAFVVHEDFTDSVGLEQRYADIPDADDRVVVALFDAISADVIVARDKHFDSQGENVRSARDFIIALVPYANRSTELAVLRYLYFVTCNISVNGVVGAAEMLMTAFRKTPTELRMALGVSLGALLVIIALDAGSRRKAVSGAQTAWRRFEPVLRSLMEHDAQLVSMTRTTGRTAVARQAS